MSGVLSILTGGVSQLVGPVVSRLLDLIPDPVQKAQMAAAAQQALMDADAKMEAAQAAIDANEAASNNLFVAGWRPAVGWVCALALGWMVLIQPIGQWVCALFGYTPKFPTLDSSFITLLLIPMLGLGTARTVEKMSGVPDSHPMSKTQK